MAAQNVRGFSLVELMVVVAIVGIVATLGSANYTKLVCKAHKSEAYQAMNAIAALQEGHRAEKDGYATFATSCPTGSSATTSCFTYASKGKAAKFSLAAEVTSSGYLITATGKSGTAMSGAIWRMDQSRAITDVTGICR